MLVKTETKSKIMLTVLILFFMAAALWLTLLPGLWRIAGIALLLAGVAALVWTWWPHEESEHHHR